MAALLESPPRELSFADVEMISADLARDIGRLTPRTEGYTVDDYFTLDGNYLVEYDEGRLQILPMPTEFHQALTGIIWQLLLLQAQADPGARVQFAPIRVRIANGKYREPDVCYMRSTNAHRRHGNFWDGADLVIEIVSDTNRDHDWTTKRAEYAAAGVPEYWIVDPQHQSVTVFELVELPSRNYRQIGVFGGGTVAAGSVVAGFSVNVSGLFDTAVERA